MQILNPEAFYTDEELKRELLATENMVHPSSHLIPNQSVFHVVESYY